MLSSFKAVVFTGQMSYLSPSQRRQTTTIFILPNKVQIESK